MAEVDGEEIEEGEVVEIMSHTVSESVEHIAQVLNQFSEKKFTGQIEFLFDMNQGGVTRLRMRTLSGFNLSTQQEGSSHGRDPNRT